MSTVTADSAPAMPRDVAVALAHATIQAVADEAGVTVLHVKGPIVDATLRMNALDSSGEGGSAPISPRLSVDADVLVAPHESQKLIQAMESHGWELAWDFAEGSLFAHAATLQHPHVAHVDVHRWFPGIECDPGRAMEILAKDARHVPIAGYPCLVPSDDAHRLILLLHAARSPRGRGATDIETLWTQASAAEQAAVRLEAERLDAVVALAAAIGELASVRHRRSYRLWHALQQPDHTHRDTLLGHLAAARPREVGPLLIRFLLLNKRRMDRERGGAVGLRETLAGYRSWIGRRIRSRGR